MKKKKQTINKTTQSFVLASFLLFVLTFAFLYQGIFPDSLFSFLAMLCLFLGAIFLFYHAHKKISFIHIISLSALYLLAFIDKSALVNPVTYGLIQPLSFALFGFVLLKMYNIKLSFEFKKFKKIAIILGVSILFAHLFFLLNEPFPGFIENSFLLLLTYTFFVSLGEELVFRGVSFSLLKKQFSLEGAIHFQAIFFTVIHLLSFGVLYSFFSDKGSLLLSGNFAFINVVIYAVALYGFAVVAARYALSPKKKTNIMYPIYFHWLVNFLNLIVLMF